MNDLLIGRGETDVRLLTKYGNRHGLIAGATGTGKTVTLMTIAEGFSRAGVPTFVVDVKGDVAGLAEPGVASERLSKRVGEVGVEGWTPQACPVVFWDLFGDQGHPVRATVSEVGPTLLGRILELNDTQEGVLEIAFKLADDRGLLLLDLDDLRSLLTFVAENPKEVGQTYGLVSGASVGAIQRALLSLDRDGGTGFFGEPALELADLMRVDLTGRGVVNVLAADRLVLKPRLYSSVLLWLLSELYETLPEVGDLDRPKLAFFFDEAHLLFDDAPPALRRRVEQVVRLIRSKGVGVYFCSQFPDDLPAEVLGQMGHRVQHALRAFTPRDAKAVRTAAETFAPNPSLDVAAALPQLGVGEALASMLMEKGIPAPVQQALIAPPRCRMGSITPAERSAVRSRSPVGARYDAAVNRESAHEMLRDRAAAKLAVADAPKVAPPPRKPPTPDPTYRGPSRPPGRSRPSKPAPEEAGLMDKFGDILMGTGRRQGLIETMAKSAVRGVGSRAGRQVLRGVMGTIFGRR